MKADLGNIFRDFQFIKFHSLVGTQRNLHVQGNILSSINTDHPVVFADCMKIVPCVPINRVTNKD